MNGEAGKGAAIRQSTNWEKYESNYDKIFRKESKEVTDGYTTWVKCDRKDCDLHVVRPGKVQCHCEQEAEGSNCDT